MQGIIQTNHDLRNASLEEIKDFLQELQYELRYRFSTLSKENFTEQDLKEMHVGGATAAGVAALATRIPAGQVDSTSTSTKFTAKVPGVTELKTGVAVFLKNGVVTSAADCTLNVNGLGEKPIYSSMAAATPISTVYNINYTMLFVYDEERVTGGAWVIYYGYNSDTNTIAYNIRSNNTQGPLAEALTKYKIVFTKADDTLLPCTQTANSTATTKPMTTTAFDPWKPIYFYSGTDSISSASTPGASVLWTQYSSIDLRYAFNKNKTLTSAKSVYIRCTPQGDGTVKLDGDDCLVQALPSTADGKVYIYLGKAYSTYQIWMAVNHPIYEYNGHLKMWEG